MTFRELLQLFGPANRNTSALKPCIQCRDRVYPPFSPLAGGTVSSWELWLVSEFPLLA